MRTEFQDLQKILTTTLILALLEGSADYDIYVNVSLNVLRVILMHRGNVIDYNSRQQKDYKQRYRAHNLELVALVFALKVWRHYLYRVRSNIYINFKNLKYFFH